MSHLLRTFILFIVAMLLAVHCRSEWVYVKRVIDGDTFVISDGTIVRVRDIDTPETRHPIIGAEVGGTEATQLARFFLEGNFVWLEGTSRDKYGRRLSAVTVAGGISYSNVVKIHGYDKNSNSIYSHLSMHRYNLGLSTYKPRTSIPSMRTSFNGTTWVNGYFRSDGTRVSGHWKKVSGTSDHNSYALPSMSLPKVPSCSPREVQVKGYFRKDGTYVKPHTRSKKNK